MLVFVGDVVDEQSQPLQCWHQQVVALQCSVQFGAVDHHAGLVVVAHLPECEGAADHVAGKALPAIGIVGFGADAVVDREAGMAPCEHALCAVHMLRWASGCVRDSANDTGAVGLYAAIAGSGSTMADRPGPGVSPQGNGPTNWHRTVEPGDYCS